MIRIGHSTIGSGHSTYIIAEAGINHNGNMKIAKKMITAAAKCGANAIKFQTIIPEELFSSKSLFEMSKNWILTKEQHTELKKFAKKNKIEFFSTPFGQKSVKILRDVGVKLVKISSGDLNNFELIKDVVKMKIPIIISTGMGNILEINQVVKFLKKRKCKFVLLHCNSSYPTPLKDTNLKTIPFFQNKFNSLVGYSDHTIGIEACLGAVSLGSCVIEKHFTLNKNMDGPDQKLSSDPSEFKNLVKKIRLMEQMQGIERIDTTNSEKKFKPFLRKSIHASRDLSKVSIIKKYDLSLLRPGNGIPPTKLSMIIGKKLRYNIKKGQLLKMNIF